MRTSLYIAGLTCVIVGTLLAMASTGTYAYICAIVAVIGSGLLTTAMVVEPAEPTMEDFIAEHRIRREEQLIKLRAQLAAKH